VTTLLGEQSVPM